MGMGKNSARKASREADGVWERPPFHRPSFPSSVPHSGAFDPSSDRGSGAFDKRLGRVGCNQKIVRSVFNR